MSDARKCAAVLAMNASTAGFLIPVLAIHIDAGAVAWAATTVVALLLNIASLFLHLRRIA